MQRVTGWCEGLADRAGRWWDLVLANVTVEPLFFILWFTGGLAYGSGAFDKLELWRACIVGTHFNDTVCEGLTQDRFNEQENAVQT